MGLLSAASSWRTRNSIYRMTGKDILSFEHTSMVDPRRNGAATPVSQIAINGVLLDRLLRTLDLDDDATASDTLDMMSTPLVMEAIPIECRAAYLDALCGGEWPDDDLQAGRVPVAFCANCLDSSCGMMWSAALIMSASTVVWRGLGWETETFKPVAPPRRRWLQRAITREFAGWVPAQFTPEVTFTFARDEYDATILREIEYQTRYSASPGR